MQANRLTRDEVRHIVGDIEDGTVAELLAIGVTYSELEQAAKWASGDSEDLGKQGRPLTGRTAQAYDILLRDPIYEPVEPDR